MRYLRIVGGVVTNAEEWNGIPTPEPGVTFLQTALGGVGWLWNGVTLSAPPPVVPQFVSKYRFMQYLQTQGLLNNWNMAVNTLPGGALANLYQINWAENPFVDRSSLFVAAVQAKLGWTAAQVDAAFVGGINQQAG